LKRFVCWLIGHRRRDQGVVGYCPRCGDFRNFAVVGRLCILYQHRDVVVELSDFAWGPR
jgi:hypothetical protein